MKEIKPQKNSSKSDSSAKPARRHRGFVAAKTGRVIHPSYMPPRLGEKRIQAAVEAFLKNHAKI